GLEYWSDGVTGLENPTVQYSIIPILLLYPSSASLKPRVEEVAQRVAEEIDAEHGDEDAESGKERQPPSRADIDARIGQHRAPSGDLGRHADAEKAQARFGDDRRCHGEGADDQRR